MELYQILLIVVGCLVLLGVGLCTIFGKNYLTYSRVFSPIVSALCGVVKAFCGLLPDNKTLQLISIVMQYAIECTQKAEEAWLAGEIDKEQKNMFAKQYISDVLSAAQIEITPVFEQIIDGTIAIVCMLLPHETT